MHKDNPTQATGTNNPQNPLYDDSGASQDKPQMLHDLLYCGDELVGTVKDEIARDFPEAKVEDASGPYGLHPGRISVDVEITEDEWMLWLIRNGNLKMSFTYQLVICGSNTVKIDWLTGLIKQVVNESRDETDDNSA